MKTISALLTIAFVSVAAAAEAPMMPKPLQGIGIDQKLNAKLPLDTVFRDETGALVPLGRYFRSRPVLIAPVYFRCPMLCSQILSGVVAGLRPLSLRPAQDFEIVVFSIDPSETPSEAAQKRALYTRRYSSHGSEQGWHFLTGTQDSIDRLTNAIGFHYRRDPVSGMFVHASGIMLATPEGRLARYLYGVEYQPKDLKLGLIEASHNRIGSPVDQILLFCYHYDPSTGKYSVLVLNTLKLAALFTVVAGSSILLVAWRRDLKNEHETARS